MRLCDYCQTDGHDAVDCPNIDPESLATVRANIARGLAATEPARVPPTVETLARVAPLLTEGGWPVTLEYPGFLSHVQEDAGAGALDIRIGFDRVGTDAELVVQYFRADVCVGGFNFYAGGFKSVADLAVFLVTLLNVAKVED